MNHPQIPLKDRELLKFREAAEILGISLVSLAAAIKKGQLVAVQAPGTDGTRGRRVLRASVDAYLKPAYAESNASLKSSD